MHNNLPIIWALPFVGVLFSIALFPLVAPYFWHKHFGKVIFFWISLFIFPFALIYGIPIALKLLIHAVISEYVSFIILPISLYVVGGGIYFKRLSPGSAASNTLLMGIGGVLASLMGTMGASVVLIRPLLKANQDRYSCVHVVVFFILIVSNVGGVLTPLGDPPLFLGFLNGVNFFWTTRHLMMPMLLVFSYLLLLFYLFDSYQFQLHPVLILANVRRNLLKIDNKKYEPSHVFEGKINFLLLFFIISIVLLSGIYRSDNTVQVFGLAMLPSDIFRNLALFCIAFFSFLFAPKTARASNDFVWGPMIELAKLFLGIFITISPVILMLKAGFNGVFSSLMYLLSDANGQPIGSWYFWVTGLLSAFLDNAPTYFVFFNMAGGDVEWLMGPGVKILLSISASSVFFGALTYIGNAPNFMVKAIAESYGIEMPSFFSYMFLAFFIMMPILVVIPIVFL